MKNPLARDHKDDKGYVIIGLAKRFLAAPSDDKSKGKPTRKKG